MEWDGGLDQARGRHSYVWTRTRSELSQLSNSLLALSELPFWNAFVDTRGLYLWTKIMSTGMRLILHCHDVLNRGGSHKKLPHPHSSHISLRISNCPVDHSCQVRLPSCWVVSCLCSFSFGSITSIWWELQSMRSIDQGG